MTENIVVVVAVVAKALALAPTYFLGAGRLWSVNTLNLLPGAPGGHSKASSRILDFPLTYFSQFFPVKSTEGVDAATALRRARLPMSSRWRQVPPIWAQVP